MTSRDQWLGGPPGQRLRPGKKERGRILVVLAPKLFAVRDKKGNPTPEWSLEMLRAASQKWNQILILEPRSYTKEKSQQQLLSQFLQEVSAPGLPNIEVMVCESVLQTTDDLKRRMIEAGAQIKFVRNPREITYLNMDQYLINADHIVWIRSWNEVEKAEIELEKPKDFNDLQKERGRKSFW